MCRPFSCLIGQDKKVTWKFGIDSHTSLNEIAKYPDNVSDPAKMLFARVEITPDNGSYLKPDNWTLRVDENITPSWLTPQHKEACLAAHKKWEAKLRKILVRKEIVHPFDLSPPKIGPAQIKLLRQCAKVRASVRDSVRDSVRASVGDSVWNSVRASVGASVGDSVWDSVRDSVRASVGDSVWNSVRASVGASVGDSVWNSVRASVGASVGDSVRDSVRAYMGSFFILPNWKYIKHKRGKYPFAPWVKLWEQGLVPSFDGKTWRLHGGKKAEILHTWTPE